MLYTLFIHSFTIARYNSMCNVIRNCNFRRNRTFANTLYIFIEMIFLSNWRKVIEQTDNNTNHDERSIPCSISFNEFVGKLWN